MSDLRKRMESGSKRMSDIVASFSLQPTMPFSYYGKEKLASAWGSFVADNVEVDVKCDLTFRKCIETTSPPVLGRKQITENIYITEALAVVNISFFLERLNYACYKHAYKRYGKRLNVIAYIEGGDNDLRENTSIADVDKRLHTHLLLQRPSHIIFDDFKVLVLRCWNDTPWGYLQHEIEEIKTIKGSSKYGVKSGMDNIDLTNTYYDDSVSCN